MVPYTRWIAEQVFGAYTERFCGPESHGRVVSRRTYTFSFTVIRKSPSKPQRQLIVRMYRFNAYSVYLLQIRANIESIGTNCQRYVPRQWIKAQAAYVFTVQHFSKEYLRPVGGAFMYAIHIYKLFLPNNKSRGVDIRSIQFTFPAYWPEVVTLW